MLETDQRRCLAGLIAGEWLCRHAVPMDRGAADVGFADAKSLVKVIRNLLHEIAPVIICFANLCKLSMLGKPG